jgi:[acyl-carrier-protein] S-malonyltransferase
VGEVSSWGCAKAWSVRACAQAVDARARIMDEDSPPGCGMLAVLGLRRERVKALCPELHVAIVNDVDHVVLAGSETLLSASAAVLASHGASTRRLEVKVPSHTQLLAHAAGRFGALLAELPMADPALPVLRGIDGHRCLTALQGRSALRDAISHSIRWDECRREIEQSGMRVVLELGPGRSLSRLFLATEEGLLARSVSDFRTLDGVAVWLSKQLEG